MKHLVLVALFAALLAAPAAAQPPGSPVPAGDPFSKMVKSAFDGISRLLVASAEKMPEESYGFKPTPEVRSFGEILGHVANTHYSYCSRVKGEKNPNEGNNIEKQSSKAAIIKALNDSVAYCAGVYSGMTDLAALEPLAPPAAPPVAAPAGQPPRPPQPPQPRIQRLMANVAHDWEHYGNLVTYLRLKGLVPPSSEPRR